MKHSKKARKKVNRVERSPLKETPLNSLGIGVKFRLGPKRHVWYARLFRDMVFNFKTKESVAISTIGGVDRTVFIETVPEPIKETDIECMFNESMKKAKEPGEEMVIKAAFGKL